MRNPENIKSPSAMVRVAEKFIQFYLQQPGVNLANEESIDEAVDAALFAWDCWVGDAFNAALEKLNLVDPS
jgi:hypothetical protein